MSECSLYIWTAKYWYVLGYVLAHKYLLWCLEVMILIFSFDLNYVDDRRFEKKMYPLIISLPWAFIEKYYLNFVKYQKPYHALNMLF